MVVDCWVNTDLFGWMTSPAWWLRLMKVCSTMIQRKMRIRPTIKGTTKQPELRVAMKNVMRTLIIFGVLLLFNC